MRAGPGTNIPLLQGLVSCYAPQKKMHADELEYYTNTFPQFLANFTGARGPPGLAPVPSLIARGLEVQKCERAGFLM